MRRGYLAVLIADLPPDLARALGLPDGTRGVLMSHPLKAGPGARAGLQSGDVVTAVAGQPVTDSGALRGLVASFAPGSAVDLTVLRPGEGQPIVLTVVLGDLPPRTPRARIPRPNFNPSQGYGNDPLRKLGIERLADFTADDARALGLPADDDVTGPMVIDVRYGSIASAQRLDRQSVITHVDRQRVRNADELNAAVNAHDPALPLLLTTRWWDPSLKEYRTSFVLLALPGS